MIKKHFVSLGIVLSLLMLAACNHNAAEEADDRFTQDIVNRTPEIDNTGDFEFNKVSNRNKIKYNGNQQTGRTGTKTVPKDSMKQVGNGYISVDSYRTTIPSKDFAHRKYVIKDKFTFFKGKDERQWNQPQQREAAPKTGKQAQQPAQPKQPQQAAPSQKQPAAPAGISSLEAKVIELTNQERRKNGLKELTADPTLNKAAKTKANDMKDNNYFSHNSPKYGSPFDMMKQFGISYKTAGENIAKGQTTAEQVVNSWMNSEGHRKNILNPNYTHIGVGCSDSGYYWAQMFIGK